MADKSEPNFVVHVETQRDLVSYSCFYHVYPYNANKEQTVPFANCQILDVKSQVKLKPSWDADILTNQVQAPDHVSLDISCL